MAAVAILKKNRKIAGLTDRHHPAVETRQFRTCTLKNDIFRHNGLSYGTDKTYHLPQNVLYFLFSFSFC